MPSVMVCVISWATLLFLSLEATQYSEAILALSWALLALVARLLLLEELDQYVSLPTPVATGKSFPPTVPMRSLLEPAGFFLETPVCVFPWVHPLVPSLLRL